MAGVIPCSIPSTDKNTEFSEYNAIFKTDDIKKEFYECFGKDSENVLNDLDIYARHFGSYKITDIHLNGNATIYFRARKTTAYKTYEMKSNMETIF